MRLDMLQDFRLNVFATVAELGSFTKAAEKLHISQAAVSQNIAELEKTTKVKLFDRLRREVVLTNAGTVFLSYVRNILKAYLDVQLILTELDQVVVKVSVSEDIFNTYLLPVLDDFLSLHPEVSILRTQTDDYDMEMSVVPSNVPGMVSSVRFQYKPTQAFVCTKTCMVLRKILGF